MRLLAASFVVAACAGGVPPAFANDAPATQSAPPSGAPAASSSDARAPQADPSPARKAKRKDRAAKLSETSTLAEWKTASASARSEVAVTIARAKLPPTATKLEVATAAMEISGCLTKTAGDARFDSWQVAPTATTCLTAPERPAKDSN